MASAQTDDARPAADRRTQGSSSVATSPGAEAPPAVPLADRRPRWPGWLRGPRTRAVVFAVIAALFFAGPGIARGLGQHPGEIENRPLAQFPSLSDGWSFFPKLNTWAVDHLPLRGQAVQANADMSEYLFSELPATDGAAPSAIMGDDGWLFYKDDIVHACTHWGAQPVLNQQFVRIANVVRGLNKPFVTTIAPDKTTVEADRMPSRYPSKACSVAAKADLWERLRTWQPPNYIDLLGPITEIKNTRGAAYKPQDTHWNDYANIRYAQLLVNAIDPDAWRDTQVVETGTRSMPGDLNIVRGRPGPTYFPGAEIRRAGVTTNRANAVVRDGVQTLAVSSAKSTQAPLIRGRTVILGDSFTFYALPWLMPFFEDLVLVEQNPVDQAGFARLLSSADRVVVEMVERNFVENAMPMLTEAYLAGVTKLLPPA